MGLSTVTEYCKICSEIINIVQVPTLLYHLIHYYVLLQYRPLITLSAERKQGTTVQPTYKGHGYEFYLEVRSIHSYWCQGYALPYKRSVLCCEEWYCDTVQTTLFRPFYLFLEITSILHAPVTHVTNNKGLTFQSMPGGEFLYFTLARILSRLELKSNCKIRKRAKY